MSDLAAVLDTAAKDFDNSLERLFSLVRIPSISTDPHHAKDCAEAAEWLAQDLRDMGFDARPHPTGAECSSLPRYTGPGMDRPARLQPRAFATRASCVALSRPRA